ncbi:hypothetical protein AX17_004587 [Amanita inopinata Kibby_2008]|nr:hypothetical protein AX17_004587 [Amanita inopinata Kibby_2008]
MYQRLRSKNAVELQEAVRMTSLAVQPSGQRKKVNQYIRGERIGKGKYGEVFLCEDQENWGRQMAMKIVRRNSPRDRMRMLRRSYQQYISANSYEKAPPLSSTEHGIRKEIAIMKRCRHPNLVRLFEVIDDPQHDKIYLIMEHLSGGPVEWTNAEHRPILPVDQTRRIIRDVIVGLDYLHHQGIIHRDIKPANLMWAEDRTCVKIIDFGVSHLSVGQQAQTLEKSVEEEVEEDNLLFPESDLQKRIGTPSFLAPEVVWFDDPSETEKGASASNQTLSPSLETIKRPPITKAIDIWSLAVTFYCLLFGHTPFNVPTSENENVHHNEYMLYHQICTQDWAVGETMGADSVVTGGRHPGDKSTEGFAVVNLLDRMLQKNPRQRITLGELKVRLKS